MSIKLNPNTKLCEDGWMLLLKLSNTKNKGQTTNAHYYFISA